MVLLIMIFLHIIDDWVLQNKLALMKQKDWWTSHPEYKEMYKYDYIVALLTHAFSWTFMIMLPIAYTLSWNITWIFVVSFVVNLIEHAVIDDLKANQKKINLITDQVLHIVQIIITYCVFTFLVPCI